MKHRTTKPFLPTCHFACWLHVQQRVKRLELSTCPQSSFSGSQRAQQNRLAMPLQLAVSSNQPAVSCSS
ncbi:hypothetical protein SLA2020_262740 [Shorea laevis]